MKPSYISFKAIRNTVIITFLVMLIMLYVPSPFVVMKPGIALPVEQYITPVNAGAEREVSNNVADQQDGELLLTAVLLTAPSIWDSLRAFFINDHDVYWKRDVLGGQSMKKYAQKVSVMMEGSHHDAIEAAYRYMHIDYEVETKAFIVQQPSNHSLSRLSLEPGDRIVEVYSEDRETKADMTSLKTLISWLRQLDEQKINIVVERNGLSKTYTIDWLQNDQSLTDELMTSIVLGAQQITELRGITPVDPQYELEIIIDNIGGPSAGLAFSMQIISELSGINLANGHTIAVTGAITPEGKVNAIGGVRQKVVSVQEKGAELFIVPTQNEKEAIKMANSIDTNMKIVGVNTIEEAIEVLASWEQ